jgi:hypothetical protein
VFAGASLLCGFAASTLMLQVSRAVQGAGYAIMISVSLALLADAFHGLFILVTVVILARVGGRLLGIRMRWRRAVLAGFPAWSWAGRPPGRSTASGTARRHCRGRPCCSGRSSPRC